ncbi:MAG: ribonuclease Z [Clostridia bacterium]|nr:ribonuclease Z [Clostridia bacterium]
MNVFVCLDDNNGMMFNNRRQSRDSSVKRVILQMAKGKRLFMNKYTGKLFAGADIVIDDCFLKLAEEGDWCFVENESIAEHFDRIESLVVFRWNRVYPSDRRLDIDTGKMVLEESFDFVGSSHDKITCEIWKK